MNFKQTFISIAVAMTCITSCGTTTQESNSTKIVKQQKQPNIVLLFVDDMGWTARTSKNAIYETPNIDQLATDGMDFDTAYIPSPTCSPSRAGLVTGLHPARLKMPRHIMHKAGKFGMDKFGRTDEKWSYWKTDPAQVPSINWLKTEYKTYAESLSELGYYNQFMGKWHLGHEGYHPTDQGFDSQVGTTNWGHPASYYPPYFKNSDVLSDEKEAYLTDKLTDEAVNFISDYDQDKPFMLSMWYYAVHTPFQGRKDLVEHFLNKGLEKKQAHLAALASSIDMSLGNIRQALKDKGIDDNTVIMFLSDQGGILDNSPLRGGKKVDTLYEGGARVPFIVYWPGVTPKNSVNKSLVQSLDVYPTLIDIAGGDSSKLHALDGVSLIENIKTNKTLHRSEPLYGYRAYEDLYASVREGDWKLLATRSGKLHLYNIANDLSEQHDLASQHPVIVERLKAKLIKWEADVDMVEYSGVQ